MRILIVAEFSLERAGLKCLLQGADQTVIIMETTAVPDRLQGVQDADVVLLDIGQLTSEILSSVVQLKTIAPAVAVAALVGRVDTGVLPQAISAGISGFIPKDSTARVLQSALGLVASGEVFVPSALVDGLGFRVTRRRRRGVLARLSNRQAQVLSLLVEGKSNGAIAAELHIEVATVKNHIQGILRALNVHNRTQAVLLAVRSGLLPSSPVGLTG